MEIDAEGHGSMQHLASNLRIVERFDYYSIEKSEKESFVEL